MSVLPLQTHVAWNFGLECFVSSSPGSAGSGINGSFSLFTGDDELPSPEVFRSVMSVASPASDTVGGASSEATEPANSARGVCLETISSSSLIMPGQFKSFG
jgi:hypothetical protein